MRMSGTTGPLLYLAGPALFPALKRLLRPMTEEAIRSYHWAFLIPSTIWSTKHLS